MSNSKSFKRLVRAWMVANPGWSYMAAAQHLRQLQASKDAATRERAALESDATHSVKAADK